MIENRNFWKFFWEFSLEHTACCFYPWSLKGNDTFLFFAARVLPSVPHQERLRGDRAEHLPPQPRIRSHVLGVAGEAFSGGRGKTEEAPQDLTCCRSPMSLCTDAPTDLFIRIERQWTKQTAKRAAMSSQIRGKRWLSPKDPQIKCLLQVG